MEYDHILEMRNVNKSYPGVKALDNVSFKVKKNIIHAVMGENGAGKSTLMNIISGSQSYDTGSMLFKGEEITNNSIHSALLNGISMIHQELSPVHCMTVVENIFLGKEIMRNNSNFINQKAMIESANLLFKKLKIDINPTTVMSDLSIAQTQMVEIAKAISYNADLIIMDEPTSAITENEVKHLFEIIQMLKSEGVTVIYITHKMDEVFKISDEVTVFRDGCFIGTEKIEDMTNEKLIFMMVGRELEKMYSKGKVHIGEPILSVKNLCKEGEFENITFDLKKGQILGIAGLMGAGRSEIMEGLFGVRKIDSGEIYIKNKMVKINSPHDAIKNKMALLSEDRKLSGLFLILSVTENIIIAAINNYKNRFFLNKKEINKECDKQILNHNIKTPGKSQIIQYLSGGNQQKVLISRWLLTRPDILILDEPTRGIDVGAKSEIYKVMKNLVQKGISIILISSELPEILHMSDHILVIHDGKIAGEFESENATQEAILNCASGN